MKKILLITFISIITVNTACTTANAPSENTNSANTSTNLKPANVPPEFSTQPVAPDGNSTPGIPPSNMANMSNLPKGTTPTPGIPDPKTIGKTPVPKGATPTPGIPDEKTIKQQMNRTLNNVNVINQVPKNQQELNQTIDNTMKNVRRKP